MLSYKAIKMIKNNRGIATVLVALLMFLLVFMVGIGVDIGYMYVAKGQLQNAADSSTLAGIARLNSTSTDITAFSNYSAVRREAWRFACRNKAAGRSVFLIASSAYNSCPSNLNISNDPDGDIVIGHWDAVNGFTPRPGIPLAPNAILNAVKVVARRTSGDAVESTKIGNNPVSIFFSKIFSWDRMSATAQAVAAKPARASEYIAICTDAVNGVSEDPNSPTILDPPRILVTGNAQNNNRGQSRNDNQDASVDNSRLYAWSSLLLIPTGPGANVNDLICEDSSNTEVCGVTPIYTTLGGAQDSLKKLESVFYDPATPKDGGGMWVILPVTEQCPPGEQGIGTGNDPKQVLGYAKVRISEVCATGGGSPCNNRPSPPLDHGCSPGSNYIGIDRISFVRCSESARMPGLNPVLVQ